MKTASFTVHADVHQSARWKQAASAEGHRSAGTWLAAAADAYLRVRARAGRPIPLSWHRGLFPVALEGGEIVTLRGFISPPFGAFRGKLSGPVAMGAHCYSLVYLPERRIVATLRSYRQCQSLASELAPILLRGELPDPGPVVERHVRESV